MTDKKSALIFFCTIDGDEEMRDKLLYCHLLTLTDLIMKCITFLNSYLINDVRTK